MTHGDRLLWIANQEEDQIPKFPVLRRKCPNYDAVAEFTEGRGWTLQVCQTRQARCRAGKDDCRGQGWVPVDSLETAMEAWKGDVQFEKTRGGWRCNLWNQWTESYPKPGEALVAALYEVEHGDD